MRIVVLLGLLLVAASAQAAELSHGRFKEVRIYEPRGEAKRVVLFLSGRAGWDEKVSALARELALGGAFVAGIDTPSLLADFERDSASCVFPSGDLENLSHFVQAYHGLSGYHEPVLVGYESGAAFAYAVLAQAPSDTFEGGVALGFCPELELQKPLCNVATGRTPRQSGPMILPQVKLSVPWLEIRSSQCGADRLRRRGETPDVRLPPAAPESPTEDAAQLQQAIRQFDAKRQTSAAPTPRDLEGLPIIEVPASRPGDLLAVLITGDGGWAGIDRSLGGALAKKGIPVIGLDSLRYFWKARTPKGTAADVDRILRHYLAAWKRQRVLLIGYSQGADVLPFVVSGLSPDMRSRVQLAALLAPGTRAVFEFRLSNWLSDDEEGLELRPEMEKLTGTPVLCVYGAEEEDSLCPTLARARARVIRLPGGHHFDGDYDRLATSILDQVAR